MAKPDTCIHCNLPIPEADLVIDEINGRLLHFCCHGCQGVYRIINGAGLGNFYQQRSWPEQGVPPGVFEAEFDDGSLSRHVVARSDNSADISLIIEGIRCASCVWLLEKLLGKEPGVIDIRVNYGTHRAQVRFNPQETTPAEIFSSVSRLGYLPHPLHRRSSASGRSQGAAFAADPLWHRSLSFHAVDGFLFCSVRRLFSRH